ncbi:type II toxin-antitoxin system death-on-curing family toxin [Amycolatopsis sp. 195334CR]|uniref:type II toxin-antitoxin system death-on-curing family toxin n=1 Tax=Amycolatopsis sp. 195334CR TaxID=2814588 RepID=UPI001A8C922B|nr:type II toxin-antitoxin system death-on-curing family toxin [Amycolatopsis sp. 195334CR]MBN6034549.1 type II toxin-antitoxin system death-on-curing family toxin [Amycolatopsis sp. 195334CR]
MKIEYLTLDDLLTLAADLGVSRVRDLGLLDAAAHRPQSSLMGQDAYPSLDEKAAVLLESLVRNHPLVDGNKRLGWMAVFVFYGLNGVDLEAPEDEAYDLVIATATGAIAYGEVAESLARWTSSVVPPPAEVRFDG